MMELAMKPKWQPLGGMLGGTSAGTSGPAVIDTLIERRWREQHVAGAGLCDDRTFVRRIYLDLLGRIPTRAEAEAFVVSAEAGEGEAVGDRVLGGGGHGRHLAEVLGVVLMERKGGPAEGERKARRWMGFLRGSSS